MSLDYEEETGYTEKIRINERIYTDSHRVGIFSRADDLDVSSENVELKLKKYDEIFSQFSKQMELKEPEPAIFYHNRLAKGLTVLEMGATFISENPVSSDLYFIVEYKEYGKDTACFIIRLNDRLGNEDESGSMSVWDYKRDYEKNEWCFSDMRYVKSKVNNELVYKNYIHYVNNIDISKDPFIQIASSIHKL